MAARPLQTADARSPAPAVTGICGSGLHAHWRGPRPSNVCAGATWHAVQGSMSAVFVQMLQPMLAAAHSPGCPLLTRHIIPCATELSCSQSPTERPCTSSCHLPQPQAVEYHLPPFTYEVAHKSEAHRRTRRSHTKPPAMSAQNPAGSSTERL